MKKFTPFLITFGIALAAIAFVFQLAPASVRKAIVGG